MYREETQGNKIELTHNHYTIAVTFTDAKMVWKREGDGNFHDAEIKRFAEKHGKPVKVVDVHSFKVMACDVTRAEDLFVIYGAVVSEKEDEPLFWSNDQGWVGVESCTYFSVMEKETLHLPDGGEWVGYKDTRYGRRGVHENTD